MTVLAIVLILLLLIAAWRFVYLLYVSKTEERRIDASSGFMHVHADWFRK